MLRFGNRLIIPSNKKKLACIYSSSRAGMWCTSYPLSYALVLRKYVFYALWCWKRTVWAFAAGKNRSSPQTFQTPDNTILSLWKTDSFDKIFMASWIMKLVVNSLQTSTVWFQKWEHQPTSSSRFERSSFVDFQPCFWFTIQHPCMNDGCNCSGLWIGGAEQRAVILWALFLDWNVSLSQKTCSAMAVPEE